MISLVHVLLWSIFFDPYCRSDKSEAARLNQLTLTRQLSTFCSDDNAYARSRLVIVASRCTAASFRVPMLRDATRRDASLFRDISSSSAIFISDNHWHSHCNLRRRAFYVTGTNEAVTTCCSDALTRTAGMNAEQRLQCLRNLTDLLHRAFKGQFVFPALGHEDIGVNYTQLANLWQHWLPPEAVDTFVKGT